MLGETYFPKGQGNTLAITPGYRLTSLFDCLEAITTRLTALEAALSNDNDNKGHVIFYAWGSPKHWVVVGT